VKAIIHCVLFLIAVTNLRAGVVSSFDDILFWTGNGSNQSALVVDFQDGQTRQSFVWGYRWSGNATAFDMLSAVDAAVMELQITSPTFVDSVSFLDQGVPHSRSSDWVGARSWGYYIAGGRAATYHATTFAFLGYANIAGGGESLPTSWTISPSGSSDRLLADGSWDAFSYGAYDESTFEHLDSPSSTPYAAIPEPSSFLLIITGLTALFYERKRLHTY
jgi:hypothetical protein